MSTMTNNNEELLMLKEITGVCPLIIFVNRNLHAGAPTIR